MPHLKCVTLSMDKFISRTGRVQSWMDEPDGRLPVSCTVFNVLDSMEGDDGIEDSMAFRLSCTP